MSESSKIVLTSSDGEAFEVDEAVAREFQIVAHMIEDGCTGEAIPLTNVKADILGKVIEYCKKHVEAGSVGENEAASEEKKELKAWDKEFMKVDIETLFRLVLAANYLNIKGLLDLVCQTIANSIKDMSPKEIRELFKIENDFTPEEEAAIRKENEWAFQ